MPNTFRATPITRVHAARGAHDLDAAATEEPLEVRLHGEPFAVVMRTPGADEALAAGFLLAEQIIRSADDLVSLERVPNDEGSELPNVLDVRLRDERRLPDLTDRRKVVTNASCGMCGRVTIDSLRADAPAITATWSIPAQLVERLPDALRSAQTGFEETGGLHAAGLFARDGTLLAMAEDIGRHNAVDKVIGQMMMRRLTPLSHALLFVSGRSSFEIVQKAFLAGVPLVAAVSAPSSLAIELARDAGITLLGFVRGQSFNIYTRPERVSLLEGASLL